MPADVKSSLHRFLTISKLALVLFKILISVAFVSVKSLKFIKACENSMILLIK